MRRPARFESEVGFSTGIIRLAWGVLCCDLSSPTIVDISLQPYLAYPSRNTAVRCRCGAAAALPSPFVCAFGVVCALAVARTRVCAARWLCKNVCVGQDMSIALCVRSCMRQCVASSIMCVACRTRSWCVWVTCAACARALR